MLSKTKEKQANKTKNKQKDKSSTALTHVIFQRETVTEGAHHFTEV